MGGAEHRASATAPMKPQRALALLLIGAATALEDGLARTPPMGWRSWNCYGGDVDDARIRAAVDALAAKRTSPWTGARRSLADLDAYASEPEPVKDSLTMATEHEAGRRFYEGEHEHGRQGAFRIRGDAQHQARALPPLSQTKR